MYHRYRGGWLKHADFFLIDALTLHLVLLFVYAIRFNAWIYTDLDYLQLSLLLFFCDAFSFLCFDTMHNVLRRGFYREFEETFRHCVITFVLLLLALFFMNARGKYSPIIMISTMILHVFLGYSSRLFWKWFIKHHRIPLIARRKILALVYPDNAEKTMQMINHNPAEQFDVVGIILYGESDQTSFDGVPVVSTIENAAEYICQELVDSVFIGCSVNDPAVVAFMDECMEMAIPIHNNLSAPYSEGIYSYVEKMGGRAVLTSSLHFTSFREQAAKRTLDIVGGLFGSLLALLAIVIVGPVIKRQSPGPILFRQERVGMNGRHFKMYKIRSMCTDAEAQKQELMEQNKVADGHMFKLDFDPRIIGNRILPDGTKKTGIGDFIRRTSIDELPQFFNVFLGQMSLVGTRPPTMDEWKTYEHHHRARLACKPGITGLWQISGRSEITDFEEVVKLDTQYIKEWSFGMDVRILLKTVSVVINRKGAV